MDIKTTFLLSSPTLSAMPKGEIPEICLVGRSNVGKSSFINRITGHKKLARVGARPGLTQEMVVFETRISGVPNVPGLLYFIDLPGFGYAKASKEKRSQLTDLIETYLRERENLKIVCLLNDSRRAPEIEELSIQQFVAEREKHLVVVATKMDKLNQSEKARALKGLAQSYGLEANDLIATGEGISPKIFWERMMLLCGTLL